MFSSPRPAATTALPSVALYACYHKESCVFPSDIIHPIHVGAARATTVLPMQTDAEGENISAKNPHFCELTATYWIWKNAQADIVGLFHYRRFLNLHNERCLALIPDERLAQTYAITREHISELLQEADVILPRGLPDDGITLRSHYEHCHVLSDLELCLDLIAEKYPDMAATARRVAEQPFCMGYYANTIICRKPLFDEYAAWLFDILFEVEKRIHADVLTRDAYQQRVYGFLGERLMTIFIAHKEKTSGLRVMRVPSLQLTEDVKMWKKYRRQLRRQRKYRLLAALGIKKYATQSCEPQTIWL